MSYLIRGRALLALTAAFRVLVVIGLTSIALAPAARAMPIDLTPVFDGNVVDNDADGFDTLDETALFAGYRDNIFLRSITRGVLEFDLDALPAGAPASSVQLNLRQVSQGGGDSPVEIYGYAGNGTLDLADAVQLGELLFTYNSLLPTDVTVDVGAFVNGLIGSGERYAGFMLRQTVEVASPEFGHELSFHQWVDIDSAPLDGPTLQFVPEPSTLVLCMLCLGALAAASNLIRGGIMSPPAVPE